MPKYQYHIFTCLNERAADDPKGSCLSSGAKEIQDLFKKEVKARGLTQTVRANKAGCLDECASAPAVVIYPEGVWYSVKNKEDVLEIMNRHIEKGEIVTRLLIKE
jgi:(2Fe-2S) ferredoxin